MYRCFPVINTLLWLWLTLLTSFLYPCTFIGALVGKGRDEVRKNQVVTDNYLFMEKCKEAFVPTSLTGKKEV